MLPGGVIMTSDRIYKQRRGCILRRHKHCYAGSAMCVQPVPTHPDRVHSSVLTMHEEPPRGIAAGVSALLFFPERSVRTFQYSKISPDSYQYWCIQEKARRISPERSVRTFRYSKISPDIYQYWVKIGKTAPYFSGKTRADIPIFQNLSWFYQLPEGRRAFCRPSLRRAKLRRPVIYQT